MPSPWFAFAVENASKDGGVITYKESHLSKVCEAVISKLFFLVASIGTVHFEERTKVMIPYG